MTTRRQFLERSALGFGSAFLLPSLLASCTDHNLPPINPPIEPPLGIDIDWNDDAKTVVTTGLGMIPEVGEILSALAEILWPKGGNDTWDTIKNQVQDLINQTLDDQVYGHLTQVLTGLLANIQDYISATVDDQSDPSQILTAWNSTKEFFDNRIPEFEQEGYQVLLAPLFAQVASLYLALLRDGAIYGPSWGMTDAAHQTLLKTLTSSIAGFTYYITNVVGVIGRDDVVKKTKRDDHNNEPFRTINAYDRGMALTVLDFRDTWPYYDVSVYPNGSDVLLTREIYSDPYGTSDNSGLIGITQPAPTQRPTNVTVWGGDRIQSVQLTYPAGTGPGGVTTTPRMGAGGGSNQPPSGGTFTIPLTNPITAVRTTWGSIVNSLQFRFEDGTVTSMMGGNAGLGSNDTGMIGYLYEALSSIHINGISDFYNSADSIVFGFKYWKSPQATLRGIRTIYVTSPKERPVADFVKSFPNLAIPANLITEELKAARQAYWAYVKARPK